MINRHHSVIRCREGSTFSGLAKALDLHGRVRGCISETSPGFCQLRRGKPQRSSRGFCIGNSKENLHMPLSSSHPDPLSLEFSVLGEDPGRVGIFPCARKRHLWIRRSTRDPAGFLTQEIRQSHHIFSYRVRCGWACTFFLESTTLVFMFVFKKSAPE